ncbi:urease accessory protein UreH [Burkholderiales bacterium JOSHI_001]|nr:urease accessory protein UreH [Burkholderiales bacterium JOSHI_001]
MGWQAHLRVDYRRDGDTTRALDRHEGPLRVLRSLYPEGPGVCHQVLVHPPGGLVGGDTLDLTLKLGAGSHALLTTPGATRFYRSQGETALQRVQATLADGARLEWLPQETLAHAGCLAENRMQFDLAPGAQMLGWDVLALGLPASGQPFDRGRYAQRIAVTGTWLEQGVIDAGDRLLLDSPLGLAGQGVLATLWLASGSAWGAELRSTALDAARAEMASHELAATAGATSPQPGLLLLRVLAQRVEPALGLLRQVRLAWRRLAWGLEAAEPRVWRT